MENPFQVLATIAEVDKLINVFMDTMPYEIDTLNVYLAKHGYILACVKKSEYDYDSASWCKAVIRVETFTGEYSTGNLPKKCPECGMKFTREIVMK